jgi:hypothetical protein
LSPSEHFKFKFKDEQPISSIAASAPAGSSQSDTGILANSHVSTHTKKQEKNN